MGRGRSGGAGQTWMPRLDRASTLWNVDSITSSSSSMASGACVQKGQTMGRRRLVSGRAGMETAAAAAAGSHLLGSWCGQIGARDGLRAGRGKQCLRHGVDGRGRRRARVDDGARLVVMSEPRRLPLPRFIGIGVVEAQGRSAAAAAPHTGQRNVHSSILQKIQ